MSSYTYTSSNCAEIKIIHQNIRSMRKNFDEFVANLKTSLKKPSFVFLSEVWINSNELFLYNLDDFVLTGACNNTYRSGGVVAYYDSELNCSSSAYNLSSADIVKLEWKLDKEVYILLGIYRLQTTPINIFLHEISEIIGNIKSKNLFIIGDINIDILNLPSESDDYMFVMSSFGLEALIDTPTRVTFLFHVLIIFLHVSNVIIFHAFDLPLLT